MPNAQDLDFVVVEGINNFKIILKVNGLFEISDLFSSPLYTLNALDMCLAEGHMSYNFFQEAAITLPNVL